MRSTLQRLKNTQEEGFTLIEILVTLVIIAILVSAALPIFIEQQKLAIKAGVRSDVRNSVVVVETVLAKNPNIGTNSTTNRLSASVSRWAKTGFSSDSTPVAQRMDLVVSDIKTSMTVSGTRDRYVISAINDNIVNSEGWSDWTYSYVSNTGKYSDV